jgi:predicted RNA binding protein YcfA (HicA-like mRNA interferase family)
MPKLGVFSGKEVCRIMESEGFVQVRQRGSHIIMQRKVAGVTTTVPVPDHRTLRIGTLQAIIRQSGLAKDKFTR